MSHFCLNLSKTQEELEAQVTLVESLRKYVGEQVPPEVPSQAWQLERNELLDNLKVGEKTPGDQGLAREERAQPPRREAMLPSRLPKAWG